MKKIIFIALITTYASFAQNSKRIVEYNYGKNSVEFTDKDNNGDPVIIRSFNSNAGIKDEVALNILNYFKENALLDGDKIVIHANGANVKGTCNIKKKNNITAVEFHYETIEWKNGPTEVFLDLSPSKPNTAITNNDD